MQICYTEDAKLKLSQSADYYTNVASAVPENGNEREIENNLNTSQAWRIKYGSG